MNDEIDYKNSPLHGLSLKNLLIEIEDHYGFEILAAYLNINCFKNNPSIVSSVKFLKKTEWAREKVEAFYLYEFKNLPKVSSEQFSLPPRDRVIPDDQTPGQPADLSLDDAEKLREKRVKKSAEYEQDFGNRSGKSSSSRRGRHSDSRDNNPYRKSEHESFDSQRSSTETDADPWANWESKRNKRKGDGDK